jgi:hypothetical protein
VNIRSICTAVTCMAVVGATGCMDLSVDNPMAPDRERALAEAGDVEQLISGSFKSWWDSQSGVWAANISQVAFQHTGWQGNNGQLHFSDIPRPEIENTVGFQYASEIAQIWTLNYRALSAAREGLRVLDAGRVSLGPNEIRARAFARFVQGLAHGTLALQYDQAFIVDETVEDPAGLNQPQPYDEVMAAALRYLDESIAIAEQSSFTLPEAWMSIGVSNTRLARIAHAYKARFRTQVARSPAERAQVDWNQVVADLDAAIADDFRINVAGSFSGHTPLQRGILPRWSQLVNHMRGMADQSGAYQAWMAQPIGQRQPFLYVTPDLRFPQGTTEAEQRANPGRYITIPGAAGTASVLGNQWLGTSGTWRWSYYRDYRHDTWLNAGETGLATELSQRELRLLRAEALLRAGDEAAAAAIIDETRVANGGLGTSLTNTDCVPRLPDGSCGDLMETLKWEHRLETFQMGFGKAYFESRGWGDLPEGTFLHLPIPAGQIFLLGLSNYTFGGAGSPGSAPVNTYGF